MVRLGINMDNRLLHDFELNYGINNGVGIWMHWFIILVKM